MLGKIPNAGVKWNNVTKQKQIETRFRIEQFLVLSPDLTFRTLLTWMLFQKRLTYVMPSHFNRPKKTKEKASIPIVKFTGFSIPLCYHAHSPRLFIFEALTPSNPDILTFLTEKLH